MRTYSQAQWDNWPRQTCPCCKGPQRKWGLCQTCWQELWDADQLIKKVTKGDLWRLKT